MRIGGGNSRVAVEYVEREARDGQLLAQLGRRRFTAEQLRELAALLEGKEAELQRMRRRYALLAGEAQLTSGDSEPAVAAGPELAAAPAEEEGGEDWVDPDQRVREEGELVATLDYRSDSAAGSSTVRIYRHGGRFCVDHDAGVDSYATAGEALEGGGWGRALRENREEGARHEVWIRPRLRRS